MVPRALHVLICLDLHQRATWGPARPRGSGCEASAGSASASGGHHPCWEGGIKSSARFVWAKVKSHLFSQGDILFREESHTRWGTKSPMHAAQNNERREGGSQEVLRRCVRAPERCEQSECLTLILHFLRVWSLGGDCTCRRGSGCSLTRRQA